MTLHRVLISLACSSFGIWIAACSQSAVTPVVVSRTLHPTASPTILPTITSTPLATPTSIPCDPSAGYCIEDGFFVLQRPISPGGNDIVDRIYPYGSTEDGTREPHHGVEFENAFGTPVLAAADGIVFYAGDDTVNTYGAWINFYGNLVILEHNPSGTPFGTLYTLYGHLSKINVIAGQSVKAGQDIGEVGKTGSADGSHLHFEVRLEAQNYDSTLNPELWFAPHPSDGVLALRSVDQAGNILRISPIVQYYPDRSQPAAWGTQLELYAAETVNARDPWHEIAAQGDLPAGQYRITFIWQGVIDERWVIVHPGKITLVEYILK